MDRLKAALESLVWNLVGSKLFYSQAHPYSVASFDKAANTADLEPVSSDYAYLTKVPVRLPGLQLVLAKGDSVLVNFEGADPTKPFVSFCNYASSYSAALAVARQGDMVGIPVNLVPAVAGPAATPIPNTWSIFLATPPPPPFTPLTGGPATLYGVINSGSPFAKIK